MPCVTQLALFIAALPMPSGDTPREQLVTLLVRIGVAAAIASVAARIGVFKELLFAEKHSAMEQAQLGVFFGLMFGFGVAVRVVLNYRAPDLGMEGALLAGLLGGEFAAILGGSLMALPALLSGELVSLPFLVLVGVLGAQARRLAANSDDIWHFSPFVDINIYRWFRKRFGKPRGDWQMLFFLSIIVLQLGSMYLGRAVHRHLFFLDKNLRPVSVQKWLFYLDAENNWVKFAIIVTVIACVAIPIKIWNNTRNEIIVEEQRRLLVETRLAALSSQINPHFLFNTLNSISSLIRLDPELARIMIQRLASLLRRLLRRQDTFTSLGAELDLIDDYLDIEVIRFGHDKLKVVKEVDDDALAMHVPSMMLQPLVENCIKHGLTSRLSGGQIWIRGQRRDGRLCIEVEDNGKGMAPETAAAGHGHGIGLNNVQERLRVLYGADFEFRIKSEMGKGTCIQIAVPEVPESDGGRILTAGV